MPKFTGSPRLLLLLLTLATLLALLCAGGWSWD
jgi:hypothetical protein